MQLSPIPPCPQAQLIISPDRPAYRVTGKRGFYGSDDVLYEQGSAIYWDEEPNLDLEPLNELAVANKRQFLAKLDTEGAKVAEKTGKSYRSYSDAFENSRAMEQQESKKVQLIGTNEMVPLMGAAKKGRQKVAKIEAGEEVPLTGSMGKLSIGKAEVNKSVSEKGKGLL